MGKSRSYFPIFPDAIKIFLGNGIPYIGDSLLDTLDIGQITLAFFIVAGFLCISFLVFCCEFLNHHLIKMIFQRNKQFELI